MRKNLCTASVIVAVLSSPMPVHAIIYAGNPHLDLTVQRAEDDLVEGSVDLDKVRLHACAGGTTDYTVEETIDPVDGYGLDIDAGDWCGVTLYWGGVMELDGDNGSPFSLEVDHASTYVPLATTINPVDLVPFDVVSGSISGSAPSVRLDIN
ncbi:MAG: hypothetical protein H6739_32975 [Alphaproteobacteria bacterium]|nr:hypothetical protein [Alphaproteobacteria bacterium]